MSYVSLEAAVEAMLKTAFQTRLTTAGLTTTSIKPSGTMKAAQPPGKPGHFWPST